MDPHPLRTWKNRTPYDETAYLQNLVKRANPICEYLDQ